MFKRLIVESWNLKPACGRQASSLLVLYSFCLFIFVDRIPPATRAGGVFLVFFKGETFICTRFLSLDNKTLYDKTTSFIPRPW